MYVSSTWYKDFYDKFLADITLDTPRFHKLARQEVRFLLKKLKLKKGTKILDAPCGRGRHSILLAQKGFDVTGIDISNACLKGAQQKGKSFKNLRFLKADLLNLKKLNNQFDVVLNMFTSFGYFKDAKTNEKVMHGLIGCLRPKGKICFQLVNKDWLLHIFKRNAWHETPDAFILEKREYNPKTSTNSCTWVTISKKDKKIREYRHKLHLYDRTKFVSLMKKCGLTHVQVFGGPEDSRFHPLKSHHPIYIGKKSPA